jgi:hypothetical protein
MQGSRQEATSPLESVRPHLVHVYCEAGQWVRMCNAIIWSTAAVFVPLSLACVGYALTHREAKMWLLGAGSTLLFAIWVYVCWLYRGTSANARETLMAIERHWSIPENTALYTRHGQVGRNWYSVFHVQVVALVCLALFWCVMIVFSSSDPKGAGIYTPQMVWPPLTIWLQTDDRGKTRGNPND